jgi:hypothetical protein
VYVKLGLEFDLPILFVRQPSEELRQIPGFMDRFPALLGQLDQRGLPVLDRLAQHYGGNTHEQRRQTYIETLQSIGPGVTQLIIHCGYDDDELRAITSSASRRDGDRRIFSEPAIKQLIADLEIDVIGWRQLRERTRRRASETK